MLEINEGKSFTIFLFIFFWHFFETQLISLIDAVQPLSIRVEDLNSWYSDESLIVY